MLIAFTNEGGCGLENDIGCPYPYLHLNPPVLAGMGRARVHLKLNGWVRMGVHTY
jgi:hypothetical protein